MYSWAVEVKDIVIILPVLYVAFGEKTKSSNLTQEEVENLNGGMNTEKSKRPS